MEQPRLHNYQLWIILTVFFLAIALLYLPGYYIKDIGQDAWIGQIIAGILGLGYVYIYHLLIKRSEEPFPGMLNAYFGTALGFILSNLYTMFFMLWLAINLRLFSSFLLSIINPFLPDVVVFGGLLLLCLYAVWMGLQPTVRVMELWLPPTMLLIVFVIFFSFARSDPGNLLPVLNHPLPLMMSTAFKHSYIFSNAFIVLVFSYQLSDKRQTLLISIYSVVITLSLLALICIMMVSLINHTAGDLFFPFFSIIRLFESRSEAFFVAVWISFAFGKCSVILHLLANNIQATFKTADYRRSLLPLTLLTGSVSQLWSNDFLTLYDFHHHYYPYMAFVFFLIIPAIMLLISFIKGRYADAQVSASGPDA